MALASGLSNLFVYCYLGKMVTDHFLAYADYVYNTNWQKLPVNLRKFIILMIQNAQRPLYYHGFHVMRLDLETFTKVSLPYPTISIFL